MLLKRPSYHSKRSYITIGSSSEPLVTKVMVTFVFKRDFNLWIDQMKLSRWKDINRLNSGIKNRHNFFLWAIFLFQKIGTDSVNQADSGDIKFFVQFPGNSILKTSLRFWNYVGCGHMRGCFILKITQCVYLFTLVILICEIGVTYLILRQPTQF